MTSTLHSDCIACNTVTLNYMLWVLAPSVAKLLHQTMCPAACLHSTSTGSRSSLHGHAACCLYVQVVQFLKNDEYAHFDRIIFDTAPTGHTLRLLSLPDFLDASIGKIVRLRAKLTQVKHCLGCWLASPFRNWCRCWCLHQPDMHCGHRKLLGFSVAESGHHLLMPAMQSPTLTCMCAATCPHRLLRKSRAC